MSAKCQGNMDYEVVQTNANAGVSVFQATDVLAALRAAGYAVVPREATEEMVEAGVAAFTNVRDIFHAMITTAEAGE